MDLAEIEKHRPADLGIHGILNGQGDVCDLMIGKGQSFFRQACLAHGQSCEIDCPNQFELVLASCGGFPKDINFIQSHKAIHNAAAFVKNGGRLIFLTECRDGIGSKTFLPWLEQGGYDKAFQQLINNYGGNGGTALAMMEKLERIQISMVTEIDDKTAKIIGFEKISPATVKKRIVGFQGEMAVIPNASLLVKGA